MSAVLKNHKGSNQRAIPVISIQIQDPPKHAVINDDWYAESLRLKLLHEEAPGLCAALQRLLALHKRMMMHINHGAQFDELTLKEINEAPGHAIGALKKAGVK